MEGYIYKEMKRYRRKFLLILIILAILWVTYFVANSPYIFNRFLPHEEIDVTHFSENTKKISVSEPFELHRMDDTTIPDYALKGSSYWNDNKYEFIVPLNDMQELDIKITNQTTLTGNAASKDDISAKLWLTTLGDKEVVVLTYPDFTPDVQKEVTGIFTAFPLILEYNLAQCFQDRPGYEICEYMLDTRGLEMESEGFDIVFSIAFLAVIIFLLIRLVRQYANHHHTPTYKQLTKYGEEEVVVGLIEKELPNAKLDNKQYICDNWIVSRDTFGLKIVRNHIKSGNFKY